MTGRAATVLSFALLALPAAAQDDRMRPMAGAGEATIYRDRDFSGPAVAVRGPERSLGLAWPVRSIRVRSGQWELCQGPGFRQPCGVLNASERDLRRAVGFETVQSMRPWGGAGGGGFGPPATIAPVRGMAAEFHAQPAERGRRIESCADGRGSADCAARTADRFCRTAGWTRAAFQTQETVRGRVYLADVLCVRRGN